MWLAIAVIVVLLVIHHFRKFRYPKNFPPGPRFPLPFIGDGYVMGQDLTKGTHALREKYGDIVGLFFGGTPSVFIFDYDTITEAMAMEEMSGRGNFVQGLMEEVQGAPARYICC